MRHRLFIFAALLLLSVVAVATPASPATSQTAPAGAGKGDEGATAFVSPSVVRALQGQEKGAAPEVPVIVSFATRGRAASSTPSIADVRTAAATVMSSMPAGSFDVVSTFDRIPAVSLEVNQQSLTALRANPLVRSINEDQVVKTTMTEANALTGVASVHAGGATGNGATVAVIDSGVDSAAGVVHPALADDLLGQACFRTENDCIGGPTSAEDEGGHGTHVTGIITGPEGVAPDARFYALKVFTTGDTSDTNILNALNHVIGLNTTTPGTVDLVNMSLGGGNYADQATCDANGAAYLSAFSTLNAQGTTIFVATGNDAMTTEISSPGCLTGAVGVGSVGDATFTIGFSACTDNAQADRVSCFSNATPVQGPGELVDLLAPGCSIVSTGLDNALAATKCGTSMATPYAAGTAALALEYLADNALSMTPAQLEAHMESTGVPVSDYRMAPGSPTFPRVNPPGMIGGLALDAPTGFQITGATPTTVSTSWTASAGATDYRVYASADGGPAALVGTVAAPTTTFVDNAPACNTLTYFVRSFDGSFESLDSNTDSTTSHPCPAAPTGMALTVIDADSHTLSWTDNNPDESLNILQRSFNGAAFADYQSVAAGTSLQFTDNVGACGAYAYRAISMRAGDRSAPSNVVSRTVCAPANDDVANAEVITPDVPATDVEANQSYGSEEPTDPTYSCRFIGAGSGFQGVWYSITPTADTRVTVSTAATTLLPPPPLGAPDTLAAIYTGTPGAFSEVACNDDISGSNYRSTVTANLSAGVTYQVFVSQWNDIPAGTVGDLSTAFTWTAPVATPANDLVANATAITTSPFTGTVTNAQLATTSGTDLAHTCAISSGTTIVPKVGSHTLWWTYTAPATGTLNLDTLASSGSFTDTMMSVYTGTPGAFTAVACNDDEPAPGTTFRSEILGLPVTKGVTYTIYTSRWSSTPTATVGTEVLNLAFTPTTGSISGTVTPETGGTPLAGMNVRLYDGTTGIATATTDAAGQYTLTGLTDAGAYRLRFHDPIFGQYASEYNGGGTKFNLAPTVPVTAGATTTIDAALAGAIHPDWSLTGTVTAETGGGAPLAGMTITVYQNDIAIKGTVTNASGNYTITGLDSTGTWKIRFRDSTGTHTREFWNNQTALSRGNAVAYTPGAPTTADAALLTNF